MEAVAQAIRTDARSRSTALPSSALRRASYDNRASCPELDCIRILVSPAALRQAAQRAERHETGADRALFAAGARDEESYVRALAAQLGVTFAVLVDMPREA